MRSGFRKYRFLALLAIPFFLLFTAPLAEGAIYVDAGAGGANNGTSWADAYTDLQAALAASGVGDDIWVAAGIYLPTAGADRTISFVLKNGVALYGGFAGTETAVEQRDWTVNVTILSGNIGAPGTRTDNSYHVVDGSDRDSTAVLDGFYIIGGNADGVPEELQRGGGMIVDNGSPTVRNCTFFSNSATTGGGMTNVNDSNPTVTDCTFSSNSAIGGGGMANSYDSNPIITNCTFAQNDAHEIGGGMFNTFDSNPTVTNCTFSLNNADNGGGMYNADGSNPVITGSTFLDNAAHYGGGIYNSFSSDSVVMNCTFSGNSAGFESGGGMFNRSSTPAITNSTFSGNSAAIEGGGLHNVAGSSVVLMNCTFYENTAPQGAGMVSDASNPVVTNTIFWNAGSATGQIFNRNAAVPVITYSITDQPGTGNIAGDPLLGPLADNGGPTRTHALLAGSAAVNAGTLAGAPATDQRGFTRPQGAGVDIGAFEQGVATPVPVPGPSSGGGCGVGFSPWALLLLLPLLVLTRR